MLIQAAERACVSRVDAQLLILVLDGKLDATERGTLMRLK